MKSVLGRAAMGSVARAAPAPVLFLHASIVQRLPGVLRTQQVSAVVCIGGCGALAAAPGGQAPGHRCLQALEGGGGAWRPLAMGARAFEERRAAGRRLTSTLGRVEPSGWLRRGPCSRLPRMGGACRAPRCP